MTKHKRQEKKQKALLLQKMGVTPLLDKEGKPVLDEKGAPVMTPPRSIDLSKLGAGKRKKAPQEKLGFFKRVKSLFSRAPKDAAARQKAKRALESRPPGKIKKLISFFKDAKRELGRVTWPTRSETIKSTGVLLVLVGISAIYLGLVDSILTRLLSLVIN
jgi:preprotein translocase subunit SecE